MQDATRARARRRPGRHGHAALATLGREAIACREPTVLLQAAAHAVAKVLGAERSAVFERLPDRDALALRSGFGWSEDAALVLRSGTRLDLEDLAGESAVSPPPLLVEQGVVSMASVAIGGRQGLWGTLGVYASHPRIFGQEEIAFLESVASLLALALERHELEKRETQIRARAEAALAESESRFARVFQVSPVALAMSTVAEGRVVDVNQRWLELFGYARGEVIGRTNADLDLNVDPAVRPAFVQRFRDGSPIRDVEMQVRRKSGERRDIMISVVPMEVAGEGAWISSHIDITDRKRAAAEHDRLLGAETAARAEAEAALERLRAIESITDSALHQLGLDELLRELLARLRRALNTDSASVLLLTDDEERLYPRAVDGYVHPRFGSIRVQVGTGVTGWIAAHGRPLIVDDYSTVDLSGIEGVPPADVRAMVESVMGVPLRIGDKVVGVVAVNSSLRRRFTEEELKLLGIVADRVAPAVELGRLVERLRSGRERQRVLARRLLTAHEEERRRLAVEMHDELGQVLTAAKINLASLERTSGSAPPHLREAIDSVDAAMDRVRDIALALRPSVLDDLGLPAALRWYADRLSRDAGIEAHLSIDAVPRLEPELETACFRVAQEALTNVARHAHARRVWLDLRLQAGWLELTVRDDGVGFETTAARDRAMAGESMGLLGMQERVTLLGGEYRMTNVTGGGAEVRARLPVSGNGRGKP